MNFPCFVCEKVFSRSQDRGAHLKQKNDAAHQAYVRTQSRKLSTQFLKAIHGASQHVPSSIHPFIVQPPSVQSNDVDQDDLPSSRDMNVDFEDPGSLSDQEGSIVSNPGELIEERKDDIDNDFLASVLGDLGSALNLDENEVKFDFLPAPVFDLDVVGGEEHIGPTTMAQRQGCLGRVLDDDESDLHTRRWHQSAGQV